MHYVQPWRAALIPLVLVGFISTSQAASKDIVDTAVSAGSFKTLVAAVQAAGLVDALKGEGPFTVLAPSDDAFAKLPEGTIATLLKPENKQKLADILTYHVIPGNVPAAKVVTLTGAKSLNGQQIDILVKGGKVKVDGANVIATDVECSNGVIHVIDQVILPASDDIPTTAVKAGKFKTLVAAVQAAGLAEALSGDGPFTVFAPTDAAFAKLPKGTVETLLKPENKQKLASILKYHVVPGRVYSSDAVSAGKAKTLQGGVVKISVSKDGAKVNDAKLLATDIDASNGVIHIIDSVILPPDGSQASNVHPRDMIVAAIHKGVPLYNAGHSSQCAKVYMQTVSELLERNDHGMDTTTLQTMESALSKAQDTHCSQTQAWTLRHALDMAYNEMQTLR